MATRVTDSNGIGELGITGVHHGVQVRGGSLGEAISTIVTTGTDVPILYRREVVGLHFRQGGGMAVMPPVMKEKVHFITHWARQDSRHASLAP